MNRGTRRLCSSTGLEHSSHPRIRSPTSWTLNASLLNRLYMALQNVFLSLELNPNLMITKQEGSSVCSATSDTGVSPLVL